MLEGFLGQLFLLLLGPAKVCSPQREAIGNQDVEQADVYGKPPVKDYGGPRTVFALKEDKLYPSHQTRQGKVVDSEKSTDFPQETPAVNVVQEKQYEYT